MNKNDNRIPVSEGELLKRALGDHWPRLHPDIQRRFDRNPEPGQPLLYQGTLDDLSCSRWGKILGNLTKPLIGGALIPYTAADVPVSIQVFCKAHCPELIFKERHYHVPKRKPIRFVSYMKDFRDGLLLEYVGCGLGMYLLPFEKDGNLHFLSKGYFWDIGLCCIPLPDILSPGLVRLSHINVDPDHFSISIKIDHSVLGKMFYQSGLFYEVRSRG
jgi:hypothetical protein